MWKPRSQESQNNMLSCTEHTQVSIYKVIRRIYEPVIQEVCHDTRISHKFIGNLLPLWLSWCTWCFFLTTWLSDWGTVFVLILALVLTVLPNADIALTCGTDLIQQWSIVTDKTTWKLKHYNGPKYVFYWVNSDELSISKAFHIKFMNLTKKV